MAATELGRERHGYDGGQLRVPEVVDVVVLGDDEALPLALGERVDGSVELQQDRPALERELDRVRVRDVDRPGRLTGRAVPEAAALRARRNVRHDVELLARILERALEGEVVVRADDELVQRAAITEQRR